MTRIVTEFRTIKNSIYLSFLTITGVSALFWHLFAGFSQEGILHWKWMSSFLNAFGMAIFGICIGLVLKFTSNQITNEYKKPIRAISKVVIYTGCYYLLYVLLPIKDYSNTTYFGTLSVLTVAVYFIVLGLNKAVITTEDKLNFYKTALDVKTKIDASK